MDMLISTYRLCKNDYFYSFSDSIVLENFFKF